MRTTTRIAGAVAGLALSFGSVGAVGVATASTVKPAPCAQQQTQVDKAETAFTRVTTVFERQQAKVKKAKHEVAKADTARERAHAKRDLAQAKHKRDLVKSVKKAQQQRLAKAQTRLATCEAGQPTAS